MRSAWRILALAALAASLLPVVCKAQEEPDLSVEQKKEFLLTAKVLSSRQTVKGITNPFRLTMSDGKITHDASFQAINERKLFMELADGSKEVNFVDSYLYNIAAYELATMLGLGDMMPVTVLRRWEGKPGSLTWWLPVQMDEAERLKKKIPPPNPDSWNQQIYRQRVFAELVYDVDRNLGNVLIGKDWKLYMIDFTRAFRLYAQIKTEENLVHCSRDLFDRLKALDGKELAARTKGLLSKAEVTGVMKRRDKIVAIFETLIAKNGESSVLY